MPDDSPNESEHLIELALETDRFLEGFMVELGYEVNQS